MEGISNLCETMGSVEHRYLPGTALRSSQLWTPPILTLALLNFVWVMSFFPCKIRWLAGLLCCCLLPGSGTGFGIDLSRPHSFNSIDRLNKEIKRRTQAMEVTRGESSTK